MTVRLQTSWILSLSLLATSCDRCSLFRRGHPSAISSTVRSKSAPMRPIPDAAISEPHADLVCDRQGP